MELFLQTNNVKSKMDLFNIKKKWPNSAASVQITQHQSFFVEAVGSALEIGIHVFPLQND